MEVMAHVSFLISLVGGHLSQIRNCSLITQLTLIIFSQINNSYLNTGRKLVSEELRHYLERLVAIGSKAW